MKPLFRAIFTLRYFAALLLLEACSSGPVSATSCSIQKPKNATILNATITNHTNEPVQHVGVLVNGVEYEFEVHLDPFQSRHDLVGTQYLDTNMLAVTCEMAGVPKQACHDLKKRGYKMPAGVPTIPPLRAWNQRLGATTDCWARFVIYADGSVWSVSPL